MLRTNTSSPKQKPATGSSGAKYFLAGYNHSMKEQDIERCELCGHRQPIERYAIWKCERCGVEHGYGDGHYFLMLTEQQKAWLLMMPRQNVS